MNFNKLKSNVESVEDIAKAISKSDILKLSEDRTTVCRITPIAEATNVDERTIYVVGYYLSLILSFMQHLLKINCNFV